MVTDICVVWCCSPTGTRCLPVAARWWTTGFLNHLISPLFVCCLGVGEQQAFQKIIFTVVPSLFRCWWTTGYLETFFLALLTRCFAVGEQQAFLKLFSYCYSLVVWVLVNSGHFRIFFLQLFTRCLVVGEQLSLLCFLTQKSKQPIALLARYFTTLFDRFFIANIYPCFRNDSTKFQSTKGLTNHLHYFMLNSCIKLIDTKNVVSEILKQKKGVFKV